jgi:SpoVK/Ycf46/Vps4 family AAA+-type ATPase
VALKRNRVARDVNFTQLAKKLEGYTGSDIKEVCREAVVRICHEAAMSLEQHKKMPTRPTTIVASSSSSSPSSTSSSITTSTISTLATKAAMKAVTAASASSGRKVGRRRVLVGNDGGDDHDEEDDVEMDGWTEIQEEGEEEGRGFWDIPAALASPVDGAAAGSPSSSSGASASPFLLRPVTKVCRLKEVF